jgi:hypothetical protein
VEVLKTQSEYTVSKYGDIYGDILGTKRLKTLIVAEVFC